MEFQMFIVLALLIGVVAGLRALTAPAAICWAAYLGWLPLGQTFLAFMGSIYAAGIFSTLAVVELVTDQLPKTPSRKVPMQFGTRLVTGGLCGAAIGAAHSSPAAGIVAGLVGAVGGTLGGAEFRARLASTFGRDLPAAVVEDVVAIVVAVMVAVALRSLPA